MEGLTVKYLVLDFETTGLDPAEHEPTQVAALLLDDGLRELAAFATLMRPAHPEKVSPEALAIQGRTLEDFTHAMDPSAAFALLVTCVSTLAEPPVVVGHNVGFDLEFLRHCEQRHGFRIPRVDGMIDTCAVARVHLQARNKILDSRLGTLATLYGFSHQAHDALGDVRVTARLLQRFNQEVPHLLERALAGTLFSGLIDEARVASPGNTFVASCESQFRAKGYLSPKQVTALVRVADGHRPHSGETG
jgi:DNA polymerase-3 subunit epsilon